MEGQIEVMYGVQHGNGTVETVYGTRKEALDHQIGFSENGVGILNPIYVREVMKEWGLTIVKVVVQTGQ